MTSMKRTALMAVVGAFCVLALPFVASMPVAADETGHKHEHGDAENHTHEAGDGHAHDDAKEHSHKAGEAHSHDGMAKHGGIVVESGHHHLEIVTRDGLIDIYVTGEDGKSEDVAGAKATAAILSGGKKVDVELTPGAGGSLQGKGDFTAGKGTVVVISLTMPGHDVEQARVRLD